jgi:hypothetical protein
VASTGLLELARACAGLLLLFAGLHGLARAYGGLRRLARGLEGRRRQCVLQNMPPKNDETQIGAVAVQVEGAVSGGCL